MNLTDDVKLNVGMVGYPNVGKSSVINVLVEQKATGISSTPGKTKHFQTIVLNEKLTLVDCPGLVFPTFFTSCADLVLNGVVPVDNLHDFLTPCRLLFHRVPTCLINHVFKLDLEDGTNASRALDHFARCRGLMLRTQVPNRTEAARVLLKSFVRGKLLYSHPPPHLSPEERIVFCNQNTQLLLITPRIVKKKKQAQIVEEKVDLPKPKEEEFVDVEPVGLQQADVDRLMGVQPEPLWDEKLGASRSKHAKKARFERKVKKRREKRKKRGNQYFECAATISNPVPENTTHLEPSYLTKKVDEVETRLASLRKQNAI